MIHNRTVSMTVLLFFLHGYMSSECLDTGTVLVSMILDTGTVLVFTSYSTISFLNSSIDSLPRIPVSISRLLAISLFPVFRSSIFSSIEFAVIR